jgi:hypothetical protein
MRLVGTLRMARAPGAFGEISVSRMQFTTSAAG